MGRPFSRTTLLLLFVNILVVANMAVFFLVNRQNKTTPSSKQRINHTPHPTYIPYNPAATLCKNCNVILVSLDTLSANHLPCYGYDRNTAPNLCKFGKDNVFYEHMYANATFTLPSHVSIFTGLYPSTHGVDNLTGRGLNRAISFLPEIMHENGYYTHFGMIKTDRHLPLDKVYNRGIDDIIDPSENSTLWEKDLELFREKVKNGQKTFMFLHTFYVHSPYLVPGTKLFTNKQFDTIPTTMDQFETCSKEFIAYAKAAIKNGLDNKSLDDRESGYKKLYADLESGADATGICENAANKYLFEGVRGNYFFNSKNIDNSEKVQYVKDLYDQKIVELDNQMQGLFEMMKDPGINKNTILIITADHGEEFMEHYQLQHITLYDSNVRIPLFISVPGINSVKIPTVTESVDLTPTVMDLVGIKGDYRFEGSSLVPGLTGTKAGKGYAIGEKNETKLKTIRDERYKLFTKYTGDTYIPYELHDLQSDPEERRNIIFTNPTEAEILNKKLIQILDL